MDARLDPAKFAGLAEGDAHVIRNAGGRASDDAIRSLVISYKLLGTKEWFVIHHTDCGMLTFTSDIMRDLLSKSLETATIQNGQWRDIGSGAGSRAGDYVEWLTIKDLAESVIADVTRIRTHPRSQPASQFMAISTTSPAGSLSKCPKPCGQAKHPLKNALHALLTGTERLCWVRARTFYQGCQHFAAMPFRIDADPDLRNLPSASIRKLFRAAILNPIIFRNEPYSSVTFLSVSESSLNVSPCFAEILMALLRIEIYAQNHGIQMSILRQIA